MTNVGPDAPVPPSPHGPPAVSTADSTAPGTAPPGAAAAPPPRKGLPPLAWVGIGCGGLVVMGIVAVTVVTLFIGSRVRDVISDFEDNPAMAAAELVIRANPALELVDSDRGRNTMTIRDRNTGRVVTIDAEEIRQGRISFEADGETMEFAFEGDEDEGTLTFRGPDGEATVQAGGGADDFPSWMPIYPGTRPEAVFVMRSDTEMSGTAQVRSSDSLDDVATFYRQALEADGFSVRRNDISLGETRRVMLTGTMADGSRGFNMTATRRDGGTHVVIQFSER